MSNHQSSTSAHPQGFLDFAQLDVFAEHPYEGNALAIFPDARGLSSSQMQSLARETNLSETTFILPRDSVHEREHGVHVRIFTTQEELPFAGHPTLGTASWIYQNHPVLRGSSTIVLDLASGPVPVRFQQPHSGSLGVFGTMQQHDPTFGSTHDPEQIARVLNLSSSDFLPDLPIQTVSTGMPFCIVPLRSREVAARLAIPQQLAQQYLAGSDAKFFYCIAPTHAPAGAAWHARMQFYSGEDPATGSAAGCAISWLVMHGLVPTAHPIVLEQGIEMLRPSRIHLQARLENGKVSGVFVGGRTISVANGRFFRP